MPIPFPSRALRACGRCRYAGPRSRQAYRAARPARYELRRGNRTKLICVSAELFGDLRRLAVEARVPSAGYLFGARHHVWPVSRQHASYSGSTSSSRLISPSGTWTPTDFSRQLLMLAAWRDAPYYSEAERAALALTEAQRRQPDCSTTCAAIRAWIGCRSPPIGNCFASGLPYS